MLWFLSDPGIPGVRSMGPSLSYSQTFGKLYKLYMLFKLFKLYKLYMLFKLFKLYKLYKL